MQLTPRQTQILDFISSYHEEFDNFPTTRTIARHFGFRSQTASANHLKALVRKGILEELVEPGQQRRTILRFKRPT